MRIGEFSARTGVSARMLRHYEALGLLTPTERSAAGYREYTEDDLRRILHIESLRSLGLGLKEVGQAFEDPAFSFGSVIDELITESRERLRQEKRLFDRLQAVRTAGATSWDEALTITAMLRGLRSRDPAQRQSSALSLSLSAQPQLLAKAALEERNVNVAGSLSWAVLNAGDEAVEEVARGLNSADVEVRRRAVRILAEAPGASEYLLTALGDDDADVRALAALALGKQHRHEAMPELMDMILTGRRDVDAADALAVPPEWEDEVLAGFTHHLDVLSREDPARARITQALAEFSASDQLLTRLAGDPSPQVAMTARAVLSLRRSATQ